MRKNILLAICCYCYSAFLWAQNDFNNNWSTDSIATTTTEHRLSGFESEFSESFINQSFIEGLPFRSLEKLYLLYPSAHYIGAENDNYIFGQRLSGKHTFIDGMQLHNANDFPFRSIDRFALFTHQTPIQLGNALGGFTAIETPDVQAFDVNMEFVSSSPFENGLGHHLLEVSAAIPLTFSRQKKSHFPSLYVAANLSTTKDPTPSWMNSYKANDETLARLSTEPLTVTYETNTGVARFFPAANLVKQSDLDSHPFKQDMDKKALNAFAKLNIPLGKKAAITAGSYLQLSNEKLFIHENALFNSVNQPEYLTQNMDSYLRFSHDLVRNSKNRINYQLQLQYSDYQNTLQDRRLKDNLFAYGDYGLFSVEREPVYSPSNVGNLQGLEFQGFQEVNVNYSPTESNPLLSNHNLHYLAINPPIGTYYNSFNSFSQGGLFNGWTSNFQDMSYYLWNTLGHPIDYYGKSHDNVLRANALVNIDYGQHHFKFGGEYAKETRRAYGVNPKNLWDIMYYGMIQPDRGILRDLDNPILMIDGNAYTLAEYEEAQNNDEVRSFSSSDTITYNYIRVHNNYFDTQVRSQFGYDDLEFVDIFSHQAEEFSLDMFTPDILFNGGGLASTMEYYGYDYLGNKLDEQPTLTDFWQQKDERGVFARNIAAFQPIYGAAYGQYQFKNKQFRISAGLRMDYYDANQPVLKDPYLLYETYTAGDLRQQSNIVVTIPDNIADDFAVYVDDPVQPTSVTGYRDGDQWYVANGLATSDPRTLYSNTGTIAPYIVNPLSDEPKHDIRNANFAPSTSFTDYEAVINWLPQFSLELFLAKNITAFAHYASNTQVPNNNRFNLNDYYFFSARTSEEGSGNIPLENAALKPLRNDRWQAGVTTNLFSNLKGTMSYQQSTFDVIGTKWISSAYPNTYITYVTIEQHKKSLSLALQYTQANFQAGINYNYQFRTNNGNRFRENPSFADIIATSDEHVDHIINSHFTFNTQDGSRYIGPFNKNGRPLLPNFGVGLFAQYRSGQLYQGFLNAIPEAQVGIPIRPIPDPGEPKMPSFAFLNLKINKTFKLVKNNKLNLDTYLWVQNVLNTGNVFNVYNYSGETDDDGYLVTAEGQQNINAQLDGQAFIDQYTTKLKNPNHYDIPRLIHLGAALKF